MVLLLSFPGDLLRLGRGKHAAFASLARPAEVRSDLPES
jgi:hypothetical protein